MILHPDISPSQTPPEFFRGVVQVVLTTWNGEAWIGKALESLVASSYPVQVIVVDNASTDGTVEQVKMSYPQVVIKNMPSNLGFGQATNAGMQYALQHGAAAILLLNQDAYLDPAAVERLAMALERSPEFGILSPLQFDYEGQDLDPVFLSDVCLYVPDIQGYAERKCLILQHGPIEVPFVQASIWMLSRQVVEATGGFDPLFFLYGEDNDYCNRVRYHGFKIGVVLDAVAYHRHTGKNYRHFSLSKRTNNLYSSLLVTLKFPRLSFGQNLVRMLRKWARKVSSSLVERDWIGFVAAFGALLKIFSSLFQVRGAHAACREKGAYLQESAL